MNKEDFVRNYTKAMHLEVWGQPNPNTKVILELIGSIYDLQQQIAELQEKVDESNQTKDY